MLLKVFKSRLELHLELEILFLKRCDSESVSRLKTGTWARLETRLSFAVLHRLRHRISGIQYATYSGRVAI